MGRASKRVGRLTCRQCGMVFNNPDEWEDFQDCINTNCQCPKVRDAMTIANKTIEKARRVPNKTTIKKLEHPMDDGYREDESDTMVYIEVPTVQTFYVAPIKK